MKIDTDPFKAQEAILNSSLEEFRQMLAGLADVNTMVIPLFQYTALHLAAHSGDVEKVHAVLQRKPELEIRTTNQKYTPLHVAVTNNHAATASVLLDAGANIEAVANDGLQAIHLAAMRGYANVTKALLQRGANVHATEANNATALHAAAFYGHAEVVRMLLEGGADPNRKDRGGLTPFTLAQRKGHTAIQALMKNVNQVTSVSEKAERTESSDTQTAQIPTTEEIFKAVEVGQTNFIKNLVSKNHSLAGVALHTGHTLLHAAALHDRVDLVPILIQAGVPMNQNESLAGETALHMAVRSNRVAIVKTLLEAGADVNARNKCQFTPLHDAAYDGDIPMIEILLSFHADLNAREMNGCTPTTIAMMQGHNAVADFLRQRP